MKNLSDDDIWNLKRGGHDYRKLYAAYRAATEHKGQPTVILAKTIKGYTLGKHFQGRNATHQMKKLALDDLKAFRDAASASRSPMPNSRRTLISHRITTPGQTPPRSGTARPAAHTRRIRTRTPNQVKGLGASVAGYLQVGQEGLRQPRGRDHDGDRARLQGIAARQGDRPTHRPDHSRRGPNLRHGLVVPVAEDLQPAWPALHRRRRRIDVGLQGK